MRFGLRTLCCLGGLWSASALGAPAPTVALLPPQGFALIHFGS